MAEDEADLRWIEERAAEVRALGWSHEEVIDRAELRRLVPALAEHCVGGLISRRDGHAIPYLTSQAFRLRALELGVALQEETRVTGLQRTAESWRVETSHGGPLEGDVVVNCGGAWGWQVAAMVGESVPRIDFAPIDDGDGAHAALPGSGGAGHRAQAVVQAVGGRHGGDRRRHQRHRPTWSRRPRTRSRRACRSARGRCCDLFPIMRKSVVIRTWAGLEARMPDEIPVIGPSAVAPGLFHAFGFSGHGFALAPIVGSLLAELIVEGRSPLPIEPFRVDRFNG